jgi:hypothetical protein
MAKKQTIQLFEEKKVCTVWDDELEKWFFCVVVRKPATTYYHKSKIMKQMIDMTFTMAD